MSRTRRQVRTLRSTRPAARIAADRARRTRGDRTERTEKTDKSARKDKGAARGGSRGGRGRSASRPPRRRLFGIILGMAVLGFGTVYIADGLSSALSSGKLGDYTGAELWDKLVDRLLDRDVPRSASDATPKKAAKKPPPPAPAKDPPKTTVARADLEAESPEAYARESRSLHEVQGARRAAEDSRKRIDAILKKVGVPER